ncbi:MAG TPA: lysine--tRNA ligase [Chloroflexota bacterium]|nr:lysine--tRNA ligase [Chloroflexota bacterium]
MTPEPQEDANVLRQQRLQKLERFRDAGIDPWPTRFARTHSTAKARAAFEGDESTRLDVRLAGRLLALRVMGKLSFGQIMDGAGRLQVSFQIDDFGERYEDLRNLDIGDFVGLSGYMWRTHRGEVTLRVVDWQLLAKSLRPLPEKWHGLQDPEKRYRQRYLDLIANQEVRDVFHKRTQIVRGVRAFLDARGYVEVETPALQPIYGGAAARPFVTHHNALDRDLFLRISDELYLKRLIIGGLDRVYEMAKDFRNEGIDATHLQEFTMIELYEAYADIGDMLTLMEELLRSLACQLSPEGRIEFDGQVIDYSAPFARYTWQEALERWAKLDVLESPDSALAEKAHLPVSAGRGKLLDELHKLYIEPNFSQPTFLTDWPLELSPLAKRVADEPRLTERFELYAAGMELANAFTELNDPLDQRGRLTELARRHAQGDEDATPIDEDFLEAMEYGMPPTGGLGFGIDRLTMLLTGQSSIREVVLFPLLRTIAGSGS